LIPALMPTYDRAPIALERGEGAYVYSTDNVRYLDFLAGIAVNALGHAHPRIVEALRDQAGKLWHCSNIFRIPGGDRLAQRLVDATFADSVFFCNSGAEAVECGLKTVRKYFDDQGQPDRYRVITCEGAFHGRTLATISAAGGKNIKGFEPALDGFDHVPFGNLNEMRAAIRPDTAAILVEPVQGEGGIRVGDVDYLRGLREIADEFDLLLFFDEIQCGMGRTGKLFAHEWAGVKPDIVAVAKGLGGGFPIGACLTVEKAAKAMVPGTHGSTFGGNPLAMAVGNAVLDVMLEDGFMEHVQRIGMSLRRKLEALVKKYPKVLAEVRGMGLILGLKCVVENKALLAKLRDHHMLVASGSDNVIRLLPPLIIDESHIEEAIKTLDAACREF
jgi:acetylornithine/N-succinyldiaminopimelate aminotransferase